MNDRLRIGDAERESAARELGEHFAMGRITAEEHSERLEQIWAARTAADLTPAFRDLPRARRGRRAGRGRRRAPPRPGRRLDAPAHPVPVKMLIAIVAVGAGFHHLPCPGRAAGLPRVHPPLRPPPPRRGRPHWR